MKANEGVDHWGSKTPGNTARQRGGGEAPEWETTGLQGEGNMPGDPSQCPEQVFWFTCLLKDCVYDQGMLRDAPEKKESQFKKLFLLLGLNE